MEGRWRGPDHYLWLPPLSVRHGTGDDDATWAGGTGACRRGQGTLGAQRHARALAKGALRRGLRSDRTDRASHLRSVALAQKSAAARGAYRDGLRGSRLGAVTRYPDGAA